MPFIPNTPESLIARSDSKNPSSTCRGLTANGRPCRRAISTTEAVTITGTSRHSHSHSQHRMLHSKPALFCWQHKEQATAVPSAIQRDTIRERSSIDTLVDRLGLLEVQDGKKKEKLQKVGKAEEVSNEKRKREEGQPQRRPQTQKKSSSKLKWFCCVGIPEDQIEATRPITSRPKKEAEVKRVKVPQTQPSQLPRPSLPRDPSSRELLRLIPRNTTPQTTSALLAELSKPVSEFDEEGYIYIFWLTSTALPGSPPTDAATALLEPPSRPDAGRRNPSDIVRDFASDVGDAREDKKTILLKIGRASNVQRRMNEWKRQCGYNLSLIRYYPYLPSTQGRKSGRASIQSEPRKVPHAHKVERLIHIELAAKKAQNSGRCETCGREHREWFEVDASRDGVKAVDEVVRRWVDWAL